MPTFYEEVDAEFNISPHDFYSSCSDREVIELVKLLQEDGAIGPETIALNPTGSLALDEHLNICNILIQNYYQLTNAELEILKNIATRF